MGEAKNRDRRLGRSYLDRLAAAREREVENSNRLAREREAFATEVQAQAKRIGMALGTTQIAAEVPVLGAPDADGVPVPTGRKELHPARIVLVGLDALLERLARMERAVDLNCPAAGKDPACECVACKVRVGCGMMFKTEAVEPANTEPSPDVLPPGDAPTGRFTVVDGVQAVAGDNVTDEHIRAALQAPPFLEPDAQVPAASAVPASPMRMMADEIAASGQAVDAETMDTVTKFENIAAREEVPRG